MVIQALDLDIAKVNPKGGAIALGFVSLLSVSAHRTDASICCNRHPLGATGGRLISSLITELHRTGKQIGVATLCMGTGAGKATLIGECDLSRQLNES